MNFFEQQDKARKKTLILLFFYALAVAATILSVYVIARFSWFLFESYAAGRSPYSRVSVSGVLFQFWDLRFFWIVTGIVCLVVLMGTLLKISELSSGGASVAGMLGGEQILPNTTDPDERKVLNVVEEMSIASGVPVPAVFLLKNESGINAFAAGFSTRDAVVGVTQGAVKLLSRDELQGVIAHEFSHIFNGDMRLNMNLTGFLNGLLLIALTGKIILRGFGRGRVRSSGKGGGAIIVILLFALLLMAVGYIGVFFCNWIKSCVSRQREFLADASSAQYTRNPEGLAAALKKIGGLAEGSLVGQVQAEEVSHFFFADGISSALGSIFSTHPPLDLRIKLLDPSFDGKYPAVRSVASRILGNPRTSAAAPHLDQRVSPYSKKAGTFGQQVTGAAQASLADIVVAGVGTMTEDNMAQATQILAQLPSSLREAVKTLSGSAALVYGLLMDRFKLSVRTQQLEYLSRGTDPAVYQILLKLLPDFANLRIEFCLPLLDLATPTLKTQSPVLYGAFRKNLEALISMDGTVTVFEFALKQVILHHLDYFFGEIKKPRPVYTSIGQMLPSCEVLLSYLAGAGHLSRTLAEAAFTKASNELDASKVWKYIPMEELSQKKTEDALGVMASGFPMVKMQFLRACVSCVEHDGKLDVHEMELLRAFAATLDCPIPPLI